MGLSKDWTEVTLPMIQGASAHALKARLERLVTEFALLSAPSEPPTAVKRGRYLLNVDAGVKHGIGAIGVVLSDPDDRHIVTHAKRIGPTSIPEAEYQALIKGLELALARGIQRIRVYGDNQAVVDQVCRPGIVKGPLKDLHTAARALLEKFSDVRVYWVPRTRNRLADALANSEL